MPSPADAARRLAEGLRLVPGDRLRGRRGGERLGSGTGASLEFQDRRAYAVGDDVRHLDWRAFARTDHLVVRQYREEVLPRFDLVLDTSRSMAVDAAKAQLAVDLAFLLASAGLRADLGTHVYLAGAEDPAPPLEAFLAEGVEPETSDELAATVAPILPRLAPGGLRVLVSDFLSESPAAVVRDLARGARELWLLQVLSAEDADPPRDEPLRLHDVETGEVLDLLTSDDVRGRYLERLAALQEGVRAEAVRARGRFLTLVADRDLEAHVRDTLLTGGFVTPG